MSHQLPDILIFLGRLHVMLVHLPIGFLVLLAALEMLSSHSKLKHATTSNGVIFGLTVPVITVSAACGWLLAWGNNDYDTQLLAWHRWTGTALVPIGFLLWALHWRNHILAYRICLGTVVVLLMLVGHLGASLTHGRDYLFPWATKSTPAQNTVPYAELMEKPMYSAVVQPFFNQSCVSCHGASKSKGGLRLDTAANVLRGGYDGAVVTAGDAQHSDMIERLQAPPDTDDHMPPQGKHQPSFNDVALLQWWINSGASTNKTIAELQPPANIVSILQSLGQPSAK